MDGQLFTWEALSAMGGASLLTYFIVQYTKSYIDRIAARWLPTDLYAVVIASAILLIAQLALDADPGDWRVYMLSIANGFLIAATAGQMQRKAVEPPVMRQAAEFQRGKPEAGGQS